MGDLQAAILGILQGATEWLPVSSTAHLRVFPAFFGWDDPGAAFTAVTQLGTLLAALVYFRTDLVAVATRRPNGSDSDEVPDRRLLLPVLLGTVPIVLVGKAFEKQIKGDLRSLYVVAAALIGFALLLWIAEKKARANRGIRTITVMDGLAVGLGQAMALIPGASRSGTTITAGLFLGLERAAAARFSFLLSLPAVFLAGVKELFDERHAILAAGQVRAYVIGTALAFVVGWLSIHWLMQFLKTRPTTVFIVYRIGLGLVIFAMLAGGSLSPR